MCIEWNVNLQDKHAWTALMVAAQHNPTAIPALIEAGADVNLQNNDGCTASMIASQYNPTVLPILTAATMWWFRHPVTVPKAAANTITLRRSRALKKYMEHATRNNPLFIYILLTNNSN